MNPIMELGKEMYDFADKIFLICRSITGAGVIESMDVLQN